MEFSSTGDMSSTPLLIKYGKGEFPVIGGFNRHIMCKCWVLHKKIVQQLLPGWWFADFVCHTWTSCQLGSSTVPSGNERWQPAISIGHLESRVSDVHDASFGDFGELAMSDCWRVTR